MHVANRPTWTKQTIYRKKASNAGTEVWKAKRVLVNLQKKNYDVMFFQTATMLVYEIDLFLFWREKKKVQQKKKLSKLIKGFYCNWVLINLNLKSFHREIPSRSKQVARILLSRLWQYLSLKCFFILKFWLEFNFTSRIKFELQSLLNERDKKLG